VPIPDFLKTLDGVRKDMRSAGKQLRSPRTKEKLRGLAQTYFSDIAPAERLRGVPETTLSELDEIFRQLNELSHRDAMKEKCDKLLKLARSKLARVEASGLGAAPAQQTPDMSSDDVEIVASLRDMLPSAAAAYEQGLRDLRAGSRISWRGPATDFREALRETLDHLAPDEAVTATPGFRLEPQSERPTMKQKARFILRNRGTPGGQTQLLEDAVNAVEANISAITRSVYTRSSLSAHTPTTQQEVIRIHHWVRLVLCDLLAIDMAA
jgi:hypothetical protein